MRGWYNRFILNQSKSEVKRFVCQRAKQFRDHLTTVCVATWPTIHCGPESHPRTHGSHLTGMLQQFSRCSIFTSLPCVTSESRCRKMWPKPSPPTRSIRHSTTATRFWVGCLRRISQSYRWSRIHTLARVLMGHSRYDPITPVLARLHWLIITWLLSVASLTVCAETV